MTFELAPVAAADKLALYASLEKQLRALLAGEHDFIANAANVAALCRAAATSQSFFPVNRS